MSSMFPNGTIFAVSTGFGAPIAVSALTNASPPVASAVAPPADNSIGLITSNWPDISDRVAKTTNADADSFELAGFDTTDLTRFPAGSGAGSIKVVTTWVNLSQVRENNRSGGDQQYFTWQYLEDKSGRQRQRKTFKNAKVINITLDYDPALAWYNALSKLDDSQDLQVLRATLPNGAQLFYAVDVAFDEDPTMTMNQNMTNSVAFSLNSKMTRYEAA